MVTDVTIANLALSHLVQRQTVTAVNPPGTNAHETTINQFWQQAYRRCLADADWDFARKRFALTAIDLGTSQPDLWDYTFALPLASFSTFTADSGTEILTGTFANLPNYSRVQVDSATTLPGGLSADTDYYVIYLTSTTIKLATSYANAVAGTAVNITSAGTGTHTLYVFDMVRPRVLFETDTLETNMLDYKIEGTYLYTNCDDVTMLYTAYVFDYSLLDHHFEDSCAKLLASMMAGHVAGGNAKLREYWENQYLMSLGHNAGHHYNRGINHYNDLQSVRMTDR